MKSEFKRWGISKFRFIVGCAQLTGGFGLLIGYYFQIMTLISSFGLALLMLLGFILRLTILPFDQGCLLIHEKASESVCEWHSQYVPILLRYSIFLARFEQHTHSLLFKASQALWWVLFLCLPSPHELKLYGVLEKIIGTFFPVFGI